MASVASALSSAEARLRVENVELREGRRLAVHSRIHPSSPHLILFIHGSCGSLVQWSHQLDHMARGASVVACDLYGCGRSEKPRNWAAYHSAALLLDLHALLDRFARNTDIKRVLVGHSAAAGFALKLALQQQAADTPSRLRVHGVVAISALDAVPPTVNLFRLPLCLLEKMQPALSAGFAASALHEATRACTTEEQKELLALSDAVNAANPMHMCKAYYRQLQLPSLKEVAAVRLPVMLIAGEADKVVAPSASSRLAAAIGSERAEVHVLPLASHQVMQEQPMAVNSLLDRFLERV